MRPPRGFENEKYPLRHKLVHACVLNLGTDTLNTVLLPLVMSSTDMDVAADTINVNPHNSVNYDEDGGPLVRQMSIIDRMTISIKFSMSHHCGPAHHSSGQSTSEIFTGDDVPLFKFLWRPIFNVYPEKLDAADDATGTTVAAILGLTKDATNEDIIPITTNKLLTGPTGTLALPVSTVNAVQVFGDFNMTTNTAMEDHVHDETLLQTALRRYTNKGALRSCLGRTRHVTLTRQKPFKNFYIDKFVPNAIRRVQPYGFFAIQIHMPYDADIDQYMQSSVIGNTKGHLQIKMITNYHEWNVEHDQGMLTS